MVQDPESGALVPFDLESLIQFAPELKRIHCEVDLNSFMEPIDSSNMNPNGWRTIAETIEANYNSYDGFVVLHGTDTMSFTASALSFMLENLGKPVILTGSQLPIGMSRTDARENLITAIEMAAQIERGKAQVPEVCLYFEDQLFRGNRTHKHNSEHFEAFNSVNYPKLAEAGIKIRFHRDFIRSMPNEPLRLIKGAEERVGSLKIFPGMTEQYFSSILKHAGLKALLLETYGAGNAFTDDWFLDGIKEAMTDGLVVANITQCAAGSVDMGRYETSRRLQEMGVWTGYDMTFESAITKLMIVLGNPDQFEDPKFAFETSLRGELSES